MFTELSRVASHVRPNEAHFLSQLSPFAAFTQLTSETQGGLAATSRTNPVPHRHSVADVDPAGPVAAAEPHDRQGGVMVEF